MTLQVAQWPSGRVANKVNIALLTHFLHQRFFYDNTYRRIQFTHIVALESLERLEAGSIRVARSRTWYQKLGFLPFTENGKAFSRDSWIRQLPCLFPAGICKDIREVKILIFFQSFSCLVQLAFSRTFENSLLLPLLASIRTAEVSPTLMLFLNCLSQQPPGS